ncbi:MAG: hypothetical protein GTN76_08010 [Candidatus Aenigmarchaeota archaeon]|nr:hypothetical protein [Candidatus Aenigmarchaeota archaeon]
MIRDSKFFRYLIRASNFISSAVNTVLLSIVYFVGIGLTSLIGKAFRKKFLDTGKTEAKTYWIQYKGKKSKESYYRTF